MIEALTLTGEVQGALLKPDQPNGWGVIVITGSSGRVDVDRAAMFAQRDKNGDGTLTREEFLARQPDPDEAPKRFVLFDRDKDGVLSKEEFVTSGRGGKP